MEPRWAAHLFSPRGPRLHQSLPGGCRTEEDNHVVETGIHRLLLAASAQRTRRVTRAIGTAPSMGVQSPAAQRPGSAGASAPYPPVRPATGRIHVEQTRTFSLSWRQQR